MLESLMIQENYAEAATLCEAIIKKKENIAEVEIACLYMATMVMGGKLDDRCKSISSNINLSRSVFGFQFAFDLSSPEAQKIMHEINNILSNGGKMWTTQAIQCMQEFYYPVQDYLDIHQIITEQVKKKMSAFKDEMNQLGVPATSSIFVKSHHCPDNRFIKITLPPRSSKRH